ncbi:response regulator transcription factor [Chitinophaga sp.]|uniref:response regulator transcription factor n=1 Tax=Chitinophaga sp. TaxID=1869181 RepID=UPI002D803414|nr:response regulator transcription factor [Chitinophaga sp.]
MKPRILLAEDDALYGKILKKQLERSDYTVILADDGEMAWQLFMQTRVDICLVDVLMPRLDGYGLVAKIRMIDEDIPILYLSGMMNKVSGLNTGADDYIVKPVSFEEINLRIKVFLKRQRSCNKIEYDIGSYRFNIEKITLCNATDSVELPTKEARILVMLVKHMQVVSREKILNEIWGKEDTSAQSSLRVYIHRLRRRFKNDRRIVIEYTRNKGYRLQVFTGIGN